MSECEKRPVENVSRTFFLIPCQKCRLVSFFTCLEIPNAYVSLTVNNWNSPVIDGWCERILNKKNEEFPHFDILKKVFSLANAALPPASLYPLFWQVMNKIIFIPSKGKNSHRFILCSYALALAELFVSRNFTQIHKFMLMHNELLSELINLYERAQCTFSIRLHTTYTYYASWEQLGRSMSNNEIILTRKTNELETKLLQMQILCSTIKSFLCFYMYRNVYQWLHQLWTRTEWPRQSSQSN